MKKIVLLSCLVASIALGSCRSQKDYRERHGHDGRRAERYELRNAPRQGDARPEIGTVVDRLPSRNSRRITLRNETIHVCDGVFYKEVTNHSGRQTQYRVVGYENK